MTEQDAQMKAQAAGYDGQGWQTWSNRPSGREVIKVIGKQAAWNAWYRGSNGKAPETT